MEAVILSKEQFSNLQNTLEELKVKIDTISKKPQEVFVDNQEFLFLMKISKRTAQNWRDEGKISFSQVGNKIYYKMADVEELLNKHYVKAFKNR
jgi:predicted transcriptional regulator